MGMSDDRGCRGGKRGGGARTGFVSMIGLADAEGGIALEDGVRVGGARDVVGGSGSDEGEMEKGEQKKVTSVDRHGEDAKEWKGRSATGECRRKSRVLYRQRAGWNPSSVMSWISDDLERNTSRDHVQVEFTGAFGRSHSPMATIGAVTRQIAALEISAKQNGASKHSRPLQKTGSQNNVSKLLTKFAAPHPFPDPKAKPSVKTVPPKPANSTAHSAAKQPAPASQKPPSKPAADRELDIGKYDGGFEIENEKRDEAVEGEAAQELALDSSVSR